MKGVSPDENLPTKQREITILVIFKRKPAYLSHKKAELCILCVDIPLFLVILSEWLGGYRYML